MRSGVFYISIVAISLSFPSIAVEPLPLVDNHTCYAGLISIVRESGKEGALVGSDFVQDQGISPPYRIKLFQKANALPNESAFTSIQGLPEAFQVIRAWDGQHLRFIEFDTPKQMLTDPLNEKPLSKKRAEALSRAFQNYSFMRLGEGSQSLFFDQSGNLQPKKTSATEFTLHIENSHLMLGEGILLRISFKRGTHRLQSPLLIGIRKDGELHSLNLYPSAYGGYFLDSKDLPKDPYEIVVFGF